MLQKEHHRLIVATVGIMLCIALCSSPVSASIYFSNITNNTSADLGGPTGQLFVDVTDGINSDNKPTVSFKFTNTATIASSITKIYFHDGFLQMPPTILEIGDVEFVNNTVGNGVKPENLPGGNDLTPKFEADVIFSAESDSPVSPNGINEAKDSLTLTFILNTEEGSVAKNLADVLARLEDGSLRIGLHVQSIGNTEKSDSYVSAGDDDGPFGPPPPSVPEPATIIIWSLLGAGWMGGLTIVRRRRSLSWTPEARAAIVDIIERGRK